MGAIPLVGTVIQSTVEGLSAAHAAKVEAKKAAALGNIELAKQYEVQAEALAKNSGGEVANMVTPVIKAFSKGATSEIIKQTSNTFKESVGMVGADYADATFIQWLKKHTYHILIGVGVVVGAFFIFKKKPAFSSARRSNVRYSKN